MAELLEIYDLQSNLIGVQDRKEFYEEIKEEYQKTGKITRKIKSIRLFLMNSDGRIYLQKRSKHKDENAGMYDKTVGGHVVAGDNFNMTVVKECAEELGFPAVVASEQEFLNSIKVVDLKVIGLFRQMDYLPNFMSMRSVIKN